LQIHFIFFIYYHRYSFIVHCVLSHSVGLAINMVCKKFVLQQFTSLLVGTDRTWCNSGEV